MKKESDPHYFVVAPNAVGESRMKSFSKRDGAQ